MTRHHQSADLPHLSFFKWAALLRVLMTFPMNPTSTYIYTVPVANNVTASVGLLTLNKIGGTLITY